MHTSARQAENGAISQPLLKAYMSRGEHLQLAKTLFGGCTWVLGSAKAFWALLPTANKTEKLSVH